MFSEFSLNLPELLKVKPQEVVRYLVSPLGSKLKKGDLVAIKKSLFSKVQVRMPIDGVLEKFDEQKGTLLIKTFQKISSQKETGFQVLKKDEGIKIEGAFRVGEAKGELVVLEKKLEFPNVSKELEKKIIFTPRLGTCAACFKADALKVAGLIIGNMDKENWQNCAKTLSGKINMAVLVLSREERKLAEIIEEMKRLAGKEVSF